MKKQFRFFCLLFCPLLLNAMQNLSASIRIRIKNESTYFFATKHNRVKKLRVPTIDIHNKDKQEHDRVFAAWVALKKQEDPSFVVPTLTEYGEFEAMLELREKDFNYRFDPWLCKYIVYLAAKTDACELYGYYWLKCLGAEFVEEPAIRLLT